MALKFLNKKGWHTGSLRNIENVWKAEQKHEAEQKKLEELRKQIGEEREKAEFRQLQEQAGLIPKQERLEFLYESGLAVGKGSSSFKELESLPKNDPQPSAPSSSSAAAASKQSVVPGSSLFEEKAPSANDAWRKLHSDPLLLIRQREQDALARVKNNPVQMAMIRKSVEAKKKDKEEKIHRTKKHKKKSKHPKRSSSEKDSDSEDTSSPKKRTDRHHEGSKSDKQSRKGAESSDEESSERNSRRNKYNDKIDSDQKRKHAEYSSERRVESHREEYFGTQRKEYSDTKRKEYSESERKEYSESKPRDYSETKRKDYSESARKEYSEPRRREYSESGRREYSESDRKEYSVSKREEYSESKRKESSESKRKESSESKREDYSSQKPPRHESVNKRRNPVKISEEERAAKLREMQMDAERHEEQRWKRIKTAADSDARDAIRDQTSVGKNFLHDAHKSVYGAEKGGSSTIEESVRRRTHYSQGRSDSERNAFRR